MQKERELQELAEARQKERREEREAREKIRQQIAQDRLDRQAKYQAAKVSEEERKRTAQTAQEQLQQERASAARSAFARIQFRLPDGSTKTQQFSSDVKLGNVRAFIDAEIKPSFRYFKLKQLVSKLLVMLSTALTHSAQLSPGESSQHQT